MIQTPDCGEDFELVMKKIESKTLDKEQIENAVVLNPLSNEIEISTDDFATFANQEAIVQLKAVS